MSRRKIRNLLEKKWEFETNEGWLAEKFLQVLEVFNIDPRDVYIPSFLDMSNIEFRATESTKLQIEYVFNRYIDKNCIKINHSITEVEGGNWYAIF